MIRPLKPPKKLPENLRRWMAHLDSLASQKARTYFSHGKLIHCDKLHKWPMAYDQDGAWAAFMDTLPRRPAHFLAMVAEQQRKRELAEKLTAKREKGRTRYLKRVQRV